MIPRDEHDDLETFGRLMDDPTRRDDPVDAFFARERELVEELPGHDVHLQGVLRAGRTGRRRSTGWLVAGAAAVAAVATAVGMGVLGTGQEELRPAGDPTTVSLPEPSEATTPAPTASRAEPADGQLLARSVSAGDDRTRAVLGEARCSAETTCPLLLRTTDDGESWINTAALPDLSVAPPGGIAVEPEQVGILRWASADTGYLAGSVLRRTTDGGTTWADMPYPGGTIIATEVGDGVVHLVSAGECTEQGCAGPLRVYRAGTGDSSADVVVLDEDVSGITGAQLVVRGPRAYLSVGTADGSRTYRIGEQAEHLEPCDEGDTVFFGTPADGEGPLSALCGTPGDDGGTSIRVRTSTDDGVTWSPASPSVAVGGTVAGYAETQPGTAVAVTRGEAGGRALRTTDGGASWRVAEADSVQWSWVAAGGDDRVYGLADDSEGFLESTDGGQSWRVEVLAP